MIGYVVNDKHPKTIKVACDRYMYVVRYKKTFRYTKCIWAHDEDCEAHLGDVVRVQPLGYRIGPWKTYQLVQRLYCEPREATPADKLSSELIEPTDGINVAGQRTRGQSFSTTRILPGTFNSSDALLNPTALPQLGSRISCYPSNSSFAAAAAAAAANSCPAAVPPPGCEEEVSPQTHSAAALGMRPRPQNVRTWMTQVHTHEE
eukprot:GHVT01078741.1.p1 GENE.GHVT01078741.1~~GHVT01078741.1.p1  ORF type:complete len:204 (+),score=12.87 GHVT01078741.1:3332-3943(+)